MPTEYELSVMKAHREWAKVYAPHLLNPEIPLNGKPAMPSRAEEPNPDQEDEQ